MIPRRTRSLWAILPDIWGVTFFMAVWSMARDITIAHGMDIILFSGPGLGACGYIIHWATAGALDSASDSEAIILTIDIFITTIMIITTTIAIHTGEMTTVDGGGQQGFETTVRKGICATP